MLKRSFDLIVGTILLMAILPFLLIISLIIKITSKGPVLFIQKRPGKNGKIFNIYKFRTMKLGSEKMVKGVEVFKNDNRITKIGKVLRRTKIDEIPQLVNVIKGEMSLVGPRPERIESLDEYTKETWKRLKVRPGMTGLAQVSGNIYLKLEDRYKLDVYYSEHNNFIFDIKILFRTIGVIVFGEDKYQNKSLVKE